MPSPANCSNLLSINVLHTSARLLPKIPVGTKSSSIISITLLGSLTVNAVVSAIVAHRGENVIAMRLHSHRLLTEKRIDSDSDCVTKEMAARQDRRVEMEPGGVEPTGEIF
jgi:hypothetical protein